MSVRLVVRLVVLVDVPVSVSALPVQSSPVRFRSVQCSVSVLLVPCFALVLVFSLLLALVYSIVSSLVLAFFLCSVCSMSVSVLFVVVPVCCLV